jgi:hypothetical protein
MTHERDRVRPECPPAVGPPETPRSQSPDFLALLAAPRTAPSWPPDATFVATCVNARHPTLLGRVQVSWAITAGDPPQCWWVPTLHGLTIRSGDRVLLSRAGGLPEPIVVGVVDGFASRPEADQSAGARLELQPEETVTIVAASGQPLVQIRQGADGPRVQLLCPDTELELPGRLSISAAELTLKARSGNVEIEASDQVVVTGETVELN